MNYDKSWFIEIPLNGEQVEYLKYILKSVSRCEFADDEYIKKAIEILMLIEE